MFRRLFLDHPKSVGESYGQHFGVAARFGFKMMWGGARCALHAELVTKRNAARAAQTQIATVEYVI